MRDMAADEELMQRARAGDLDAFAALFDRHLQRLQRFFYRFFGDAGGAEDAAQEVFWRLWQHRAAYDRTRPFTAWLYGIARHVALNEMKKPYRRATPFTSLTASEQQSLGRL